MEDKIAVIKHWLGTGSINIFGRPFAGKDTQGAVLAELLGGKLISSGDVLRHSSDNTEIQTIMAAGGIIPSDLFESVVRPYLGREELHDIPLILSEVGRIRGEDDMIMDVTQTSGHETKAVVFLNLSEEEVWKRFTASQQNNDRGARQDDKASVLQKRLDNYQSLVIPVIEHYRDLGMLIEIDGSLSREAVTEVLLNELTNFAKS